MHSRTYVNFHASNLYVDLTKITITIRHLRSKLLKHTFTKCKKKITFKHNQHLNVQFDYLFSIKRTLFYLFIF